MLKDRLKTNTQILAGDICYVYAYHDRKNVHSFDDLARIKVRDVIPEKGRDGVMVSGDMCDREGNIAGFVVYRENGRFIETSDGLKYVSYITNKKGFAKCLKPVCQESYLQLILILKFKDEAEIGVDIFPDMLFASDKDVSAFLPCIKYKNSELTTSGVNITINGNKYTYPYYQIYLGDKMYDSDASRQKFFSTIFKKYPDKNKAVHMFQAAYSLKPSAYEYETITAP